MFVDLSYQAVARSLTASSTLSQIELLKDISQNFPSLTSSLARVSVDDDLRTSIQLLQKVMMINY